MIGVRKGPQEGRCGTKRRNKEKSTAQEENRNTFDLGESFCNKACTFTTIGFHIKYPLVINNLAPFGRVYQFIDFVLVEYVYQARVDMWLSIPLVLQLVA